MRRLARPGYNADFLSIEELSVKAEFLVRPGRLQQIVRLVETLFVLADLHPESLVILLCMALANSKLQASPGKLVYKGRAFRYHDRIVNGQYNRPCTKPDGVRQTRQMRCEGQWIRADTKVVEMLFGHPDGMETECLRQLHLLDSLAKYRVLGLPPML